MYVVYSLHSTFPVMLFVILQCVIKHYCKTFLDNILINDMVLNIDWFGILGP